MALFLLGHPLGFVLLLLGITRKQHHKFRKGLSGPWQSYHRKMHARVYLQWETERFKREKLILRQLINICFCIECFPQSSLSLFNTKICAGFLPCSSPLSLPSSMKFGGLIIWCLDVLKIKNTRQVVSTTITTATVCFKIAKKCP